MATPPSLNIRVGPFCKESHNQETPFKFFPKIEIQNNDIMAVSKTLIPYQDIVDGNVH